MKKAQSSPKKTVAKKSVPRKKPAKEVTPLMTEASSRRNLSSTIQRTDKYKNIEDGMIPFKNSNPAYGKRGSAINVKDAVVLCQKAYYNFAIFRNMIDLMTEFSISKLYFRGGSKKSKKFFESLFNKINLWSFQDVFFREYFRSGNVFIYRFDAKLRQEDANKISQVFGDQALGLNDKEIVYIPSRYCVLNPADIGMTGSLSFSQGV